MLLNLFLAAAAAAQPALTLDAATCADGAKREAFLKSYKGPNDLPVLARLKQGSEDNQKAFTAKLDRLAERAHWSADRKAEFGMSILSDPEFERLLQQNMARLEGMMKKVEGLKIEKDEAKQCAIVLDMLADLPPIEAAANAQWSLIDAKLDAEAKKAGVTLE